MNKDEYIYIIGAHFHPTPQPPPVPQQLGEKAHLRTVAAVLANATATTLVYPSVQGPAPARRPRGPAPAGPRGPAPACGPHCSSSILPVYQEFASLRLPLGGRTRLVVVNNNFTYFLRIQVAQFCNTLSVLHKIASCLTC